MSTIREEIIVVGTLCDHGANIRQETLIVPRKDHEQTQADLSLNHDKT